MVDSGVPRRGRTRPTGAYGNCVVGYYEDSHSLYHGFVYDGMGYKGLDYSHLYRGILTLRRPH